MRKWMIKLKNTKWKKKKSEWVFSVSLSVWWNEGAVQSGAPGWHPTGEQPRPSKQSWLNPGDKPLKANLASSTFPQILCYCPRLHSEMLWSQWTIKLLCSRQGWITDREFNSELCTVKLFLWFSFSSLQQTALYGFIISHPQSHCMSLSYA